MRLKEYELYIPLYRADGRPVSAARIRRLKSELTRRFGGLTYFPQRNQGLWRINRNVYRDRIVIFRVLTQSSPSNRGYWVELKKRLQKDLQQRRILIVERTVTTV